MKYKALLVVGIIRVITFAGIGKADIYAEEIKAINIEEDAVGENKQESNSDSHDLNDEDCAERIQTGIVTKYPDYKSLAGAEIRKKDIEVYPLIIITESDGSAKSKTDYDNRLKEDEFDISQSMLNPENNDITVTQKDNGFTDSFSVFGEYRDGILASSKVEAVKEGYEVRNSDLTVVYTYTRLNSDGNIIRRQPSYENSDVVSEYILDKSKIKKGENEITVFDPNTNYYSSVWITGKSDEKRENHDKKDEEEKEKEETKQEVAPVVVQPEAPKSDIPVQPVEKETKEEKITDKRKDKNNKHNEDVEEKDEEECIEEQIIVEPQPEQIVVEEEVSEITETEESYEEYELEDSIDELELENEKKRKKRVKAIAIGGIATVATAAAGTSLVVTGYANYFAFILHNWWFRKKRAIFAGIITDEENPFIKIEIGNADYEYTWKDEISKLSDTVSICDIRESMMCSGCKTILPYNTTMAISINGELIESTVANEERLYELLSKCNSKDIAEVVLINDKAKIDLEFKYNI